MLKYKLVILTVNLREMQSTSQFSQWTAAVGSCNRLDLVFSNFSDFRNSFVDSGILKPDTRRPLLVIDIFLPFVICTQNFEYSYSNLELWDYTVFYNNLPTYERSDVHDLTSVAVAVASLNVVIRESMKQEIPRSFVTTSTSILVLQGTELRKKL
jgi:hypothetical protein